MKWWHQLAITIQRTTKWLISAIILTFLVGYAANVSVVAWKDLPDTTLVHVVGWLIQPDLHRIIIFAILVLWLCLVVMSRILLKYNASQPSAALHDTSTLFSESEIRRNMIRLVRRKSEPEKQPLQAAILAELGLQEQSDALNLPRNLRIKLVDETMKLLPEGVKPVDIFDQYGDMLILGLPGSGKSTLLNELNRDLLSKAIDDPSRPVPVLFNLSSWAVKPAPLTDWFKYQLCNKFGYSFPSNLASFCVNGNAILPLLDGLDEVGRDKLPACIQAINDFRRSQTGLTHLIICSRKAEYYAQMQMSTSRSGEDNKEAHIEQDDNALKGGFDFQLTELEILALTDQQIEQHLSGFGEHLTSLQKELQHDTILRNLASSPLILHILTLASLRASIEELHQGSPDGKLRSIFAFYTELMLDYVKEEKHIFYTPRKTYHWLKWLAQQIKQQGQIPFYLKGMQAPWSPNDWQYRLYNFIANGIIAFLIVEALLSIGDFSLTNLWFGLLTGITIGIFITFTSRNQVEKPGWSWKSFRHNLIILLPITCIYTFICYGYSTWNSFLVTLLFFVGLLAISMTLILALGKEITPVELKWAKSTMRRNFFKIKDISGSIVLVVILALMIFSLIIDPHYVVKTFLGAQNNQPAIIFILKIIALPVILLLASLLSAGILSFLIAITAIPVSGFSNKYLETNQRNQSNQGIWPSLQSSLLIFLLCFISITVIWGIIEAQGGGSSHITADLPFGLFAFHLGLAVATIVAIFYGGAASIKHGLLRLILFISQEIPWNYARFLDFAADCLLLRHTEQGYEFIHPLLLEHFISDETDHPLYAVRETALEPQ